MGWVSRISRLTARRVVVAPLALFLMLSVRALFSTSLPLACRVLAPWFKERSFKKSTDSVLRADIAWAVALASRYVRGGRCLDRALVAKALLSLYRCNCILRVGVATAPSGALIGHAWIESASGIVVGGDQAEIDKYKALPQVSSLEQQIVFFLALQRNFGANARNRALEEALDVR